MNLLSEDAKRIPGNIIIRVHVNKERRGFGRGI